MLSSQNYAPGFNASPAHVYTSHVVYPQIPPVVLLTSNSIEAGGLTNLVDFYKHVCTTFTV